VNGFWNLLIVLYIDVRTGLVAINDVFFSQNKQRLLVGRESEQVITQ
jgi:hypothetical protein